MTEHDWRIVEVETVEEVMGAEALYDGAARREWAERFLASPGHHLLLALAADAEGPVGMVSGVQMTHPDKGTEMMLYELAVAESHRRRGIGRGLVDALGQLARAHGCYGMWVPVDADNEAALATYRSAGGRTEELCQVPVWDFAPPEPSEA
ncbi:GNAT family N-acetyltransferase [Streptomyces sedi]|uniref:GNAT family N-acetyltransferase n=1 Tax=Streptomyces sedi TaxID=555059 RepID=A0A5C4UWV5_9ACTN|nr:GNAT family N-acetyltransferase [Streptomyces sedi]TNM27998.1 GNAT family N-acetyltransferase [Streptomyces sedi]